MFVPMRLAINAISASSGGGRVYMQNLTQELTAMYPRLIVDVILAATDSSSHWPQSGNVNYIDSGVSSIMGRFIFERWKMPTLAVGYKWDWLLCPNGMIPGNLKGTKIVVVIQNQLLWDPPRSREFGLSKERLRLFLLRRASIHALKKADKVIYVSNFIKKSAEEISGIDTSKKAKVIYLALEDAAPQDSHSIIPAGTEFFFYPSPFFPYKRQLDAVLAFENFCESNPQDTKTILVLAGEVAWKNYAKLVLSKVSKSRFKDRVKIIPRQPRQVIIDLYSRSRAILFTSICESFSLILLEGIRSGAPVICANASALPEIGGDLAEFYTVGQISSMSKSLSATPHKWSHRKPKSLGSDYVWNSHCASFGAFLGFT